MPDLSRHAISGRTIAVRVTPKASRNRISEAEDGNIHIYVTTVPEHGKATAQAQKLLAKALGVAKTRLTLVRGASSRDKVFKLD